MKDAAINKAATDRMMFAGAAEQLAMDEENAKLVQNTGLKRLVAYEWFS